MMQTLLQDLRYGARTLSKSPGFTLIAVLTLALGIGANTAIFSVVDGVLLKPLPYAEPEKLVMIYGNFLALNMTNMNASAPELADYRRQTRSFEGVGAYDSFSVNLAPNDGGEPERVECGSLTPEMFTLLKIPAYRGRVFSSEDAQDGRDDVVALSYGLWRRRFAGDPAVVGSRISVNGVAATVIGVTPPGFAFPQSAEIWRPLRFTPGQLDQQRRGARYLTVVARLKPGVGLAAAQAEMDQLSGQLTQEYPRNYGPERRWRVSLTPMLDASVGEVRRPLLVLLGAVAFIALIACANVANLSLARAVARRQELVVRMALGARRSRIARQLLTESLLLALIGGAVGLLLGVWGVDLLQRILPEDLPRLGAIGVDMRVLLVTGGMALLTGALFGLAPAFVGSRADLNDSLKEGGRSAVAGANRQRLRNAFVIGEIALALVLLTGAGLALKSFWRLQDVDPGFNPDGVLTMRMLAPVETYPQPGQRVAFYRRMVEAVGGLPNVEAVSAASRLPMAPGGNSGSISGEHSAVGPNDAPVEAEWSLVTPEHFKALGVQLLGGRSFTDADADGAPLVAVVDESFARRFYPNEDPIGKRIKRGRLDSQRPWLTIVGVVRHVRNQRLDVDSRAQVYFPFYQDPSFSDMALAVRVKTGDPAAVANAARAAARTVERNQPIYRVKTMRQIVAESASSRRLSLFLLSVFALVALALASAGIYGVMSHAVAQRTHELGIRLALGAQPKDLLKLVVSQGLKLTAAGVAIGLAGALALTRLMQDLLFGVRATDPLTFGTVAGLLALVALLACYAPARRAMNVDPMVALRYE